LLAPWLYVCVWQGKVPREHKSSSVFSRRRNSEQCAWCSRWLVAVDVGALQLLRSGCALVANPCSKPLVFRTIPSLLRTRHADTALLAHPRANAGASQNFKSPGILRARRPTSPRNRIPRVSSAAYEHTELRRQHTMLTNVRRIGIAACRASAFGVRLRTAGCLAGSTQVRCLSSVTAAGDDTRRAGRPFKFYDYVVIGCGSGTTGCDHFM